MYAFVGKAADRAVMVVKVSDVKKAEDALLAAGIQTLDADDVYRA